MDKEINLFTFPRDMREGRGIKRSLHVFVVGNDDSVFDFSSPLFHKVSSYTKILGHVTIFCRTRKIFSKALILQGPLTIYAVCAKNPMVFLVRTFVLGRRAIRRESSSFRIVTADNPFEEGLTAWLLARFSRMPLHLQVHTDIMSPFFRRASWKEGVRYLLARFLIPCADCMRVVSQRIKDSVRFPIVVVLPIWTGTAKFLKAKPHPSVEERFR